MKVKQSIILFVLISGLIAACNQIDFKKTKGGVPYKIISSGKGNKILEGNIVKYHLTVHVKMKYNNKDTLLGTTYGSFPRYDQVTSITNNYENPVMEMLKKAKSGDSIYYIQSVDSFIAHDPNIVKQTPFRKGDELESGIKILTVFSSELEAQTDVQKERAAYSAKQEAENMQKIKTDPVVKAQMQTDDKIINDYLKTNHIQANKTEMGTYVQVLTPGQGDVTPKGKFAMIKYTGANLAGEVFDTNDKPGAPLLPLQIGRGGTIPGFEDGIRQLKKGEKAKIYIPSPLGYGTHSMGGKIQPNEVLVFTIELVDITDNPPMRPQMPVKIDTTQKHK